ncbi:MAG: hypothetical protein EBT64_10115, partial [Gammaproteobacteria bacterium]|nr:hypothetical protein [Gammaproteobacteria bacterium]
TVSPAVPSWLSFDTSFCTFSGTPGSSDVQAATLYTVTASKCSRSICPP